MAQSAIEAVALKCISPCDNLPPAKQQMLVQLLCARLCGNLTAEATLSQCYVLIQDTKPAQKVNSIVDTTPDPIAPNATGDMLGHSTATRSRARNWSKYEDQRLLAGVCKYGLNNWALVSRFIGNGRTRSQCSQRWNRGLDPALSKAPWTPEEEAQLAALVKEYGEKSWKRIAVALGNRSDVQCRYHFQQMRKRMTNDILKPKEQQPIKKEESVVSPTNDSSLVDQIFNVQVLDKGIWDPWCDSEFEEGQTLLF